MRPLVILRPEPGASATARAAEAKALRPLLLPLFEVRAINWEVPQASEFDALLLTSANAVRNGGAGLHSLRPLPAYCVGEATAAAARSAGLAVAAVGAAGVHELLSTVPASVRLLHLCGARWREAGGSGHSIIRLPVYDSAELPRPESLEEADGAVVAVHSPRAASTFARHVDGAGLGRNRIAIAAISTEAATAAGAGWQAVETAGTPTDEALLAIASRLCHNAE